MEIPAVILEVDVVTFAIRDGRLHVLLVKRSQAPFAGAWALPGARLASGERLADAARRALVERTGLDIAYLEQLFTFDDPSPGRRAIRAGRPSRSPISRCCRCLQQPTSRPVEGSNRQPGGRPTRPHDWRSTTATFSRSPASASRPRWSMRRSRSACCPRNSLCASCDWSTRR